MLRLFKEQIHYLKLQLAGNDIRDVIGYIIAILKIVPKKSNEIE
jgi:hypothetical protein